MKDINIIFSEYSHENLNKDYFIFINIFSQSLTLFQDFKEIAKYKVSTSRFGEGSEMGSNKTPLGAHFIKEYIGQDSEPLTIFEARIPTNKKTNIISDCIYSKEDIISSRILWLEGLEEGKNKGFKVDTFQRYIYIHGTNEEGMLGNKASHGCIRMGNSDIIDLCNKKIINTLVYISN